MVFLRNTFSSFLVLIFANLAMLGGVILALSNSYLNANFYQDDFFESVLYEDWVDKIAVNLTEEQPRLAGAFSNEQLVEAIKVVLPISLLQETANSVLNQLRDAPFSPNLIISNEALKKNIRSYFLTHKKIIFYLDLTSLDYLATEVEISLSEIPYVGQKIISLMISNFGFLFKVVIAMLLVPLGLIVVLYRKSFRAGFIRNGIALLLGGGPLVMLTYLVPGQFYDLLLPITTYLFKYGGLLVLAGVFSFFCYGLSLWWERRYSLKIS